MAVTQHQWTAIIPKDAPGEKDNVPDRPWGVVLVTADNPVTAISAVPLIHFPDDAPILYVTKHGIPKVTQDELKRLNPTGIVRDNDTQVIVVGAAANKGVLSKLDSMGLTHDEITASGPAKLANKIDAYYGKIEDPDTGVPTMGPVASTGGNGVMDVMIGSIQDWKFALPATHWVSHMPAGMLWVTKNGIPQATVKALKRRNGKAHIYLFGGPDQISHAIAKKLSQYGGITRIDSGNPIVYNGNPPNNLEMESIAFAKMWDPAGAVGWDILGPGHGFTVANINDWPGIVASAPLSHMGFHAPLLITTNGDSLPDSLASYFKLVSPTFRNTPAEGPYDMTYIIGDYKDISWKEQTQIDHLTGISPARPADQNTGTHASPKTN
ncbi:MAG: hypothetical protein PF501_14785 [Salinisphaera sp.]|nr:hypothetical protein [Salinisphaera sp.]